MKKSILVATLLAAAFAAQAQTTDTLKKIKDTGAVVMGVRGSSGALSYTLGEGKYAGFHVELCQHALEDIRKQLALPKLDIKYQEVTSANRIPLVQNGTVDIECGSTTNNEGRAKDVAFAHTAYVEEVRILTKVNSGIKGIADLNGKSVATTTGTTSVQLLRKHERDRQRRQGDRQRPAPGLHQPLQVGEVALAREARRIDRFVGGALAHHLRASFDPVAHPLLLVSCPRSCARLHLQRARRPDVGPARASNAMQLASAAHRRAGGRRALTSWPCTLRSDCCSGSSRPPWWPRTPAGRPWCWSAGSAA